MKKEDLVVGKYPGYIVFTDKSRNEQLASVSHAGDIVLYVPEGKLSAFAAATITSTAQEKRQQFNTMLDHEIVEHPCRLLDWMLDKLTQRELNEFLSKGYASVREKCTILRGIYTARS